MREDGGSKMKIKVNVGPRYGNKPWWIKTPRRLIAKEAAKDMALTFSGGDERQFIKGIGIYTSVRAIYPAWLAMFYDVAEDYAATHNGKPLTLKIVSERVDKMYSKHDARRNTKRRCISSEHPDNSPSYGAL
jgi:hypothetical protein